MQSIREATTFHAPVRFNIPPTQSSQRFVAADTTPSVLNHEYWIANNIGAVTVTNFDDGSDCHELRVLGDGFTTVANNANIKTNTGANKLLAANKVYRFTNFNGVWYEDA
jgi:hypothetical protein